MSTSTGASELGCPRNRSSNIIYDCNIQANVRTICANGRVKKFAKTFPEGKTTIAY